MWRSARADGAHHLPEPGRRNGRESDRVCGAQLKLEASQRHWRGRRDLTAIEQLGTAVMGIDARLRRAHESFMIDVAEFEDVPHRRPWTPKRCQGRRRTAGSAAA